MNRGSPERRKTLFADLGLGLSALLWGGDYVILKIALDGVSPLYINAIRFGAAFVLMAAVFHKKLRLINVRVLLAGLVVGLFMFAAFAAQTIGLKYTTAGKSAFLTSNYVIIIPFFAWILYRRFPGLHVFIASALCIAGVAFIAFEGKDGFSLGIGDILTLLSAVFFSMNIVAVEHYVKKTDPIALTIMETGFGALFFAAAGLLFEPLPGPFSSVSLLSLLYLATLGTALTHIVANVALKYTSSSHASIIFTLETVFAVLFGFLFLREGLSLKMGAGFALILGAVLLAELGGRKRVKTDPAPDAPKRRH